MNKESSKSLVKANQAIASFYVSFQVFYFSTNVFIGSIVNILNV